MLCSKRSSSKEKFIKFKASLLLPVYSILLSSKKVTIANEEIEGKEEDSPHLHQVDKR